MLCTCDGVDEDSFRISQDMQSGKGGFKLLYMFRKLNHLETRAYVLTQSKCRELRPPWRNFNSRISREQLLSLQLVGPGTACCGAAI